MSIEKQLSGSGEVYIPEVSACSKDQGGPSNIQMSEMTMDSGSKNGTVAAGAKPKKKVIHFADGSTLEDDDEDDTHADVQIRNHTPEKSSISSLEGVAPVDPSKMQWPAWMRHYSSKAGTKTLTVLEGMGGTAAYYLGITTPKYQSEIDEYNRMVAKKKTQEEELVSWSSGPHSQKNEPVVDDIKKNPDQSVGVIMTEK